MEQCKCSFLFCNKQTICKLTENFLDFFTTYGICFPQRWFYSWYTITQNEFWIDVCRLPSSQRKGHCLTSKRNLDWWCNTPFFCAYTQETFTGSQMIFFFLLFLDLEMENKCWGNSPHEWSKRLHTTIKSGRMPVSVRLNKFRQIGNSHTSLVGETFLRFQRCHFTSDDFLF